MQSLLERITINSEQCGGRPCIRGMRIRVTDVLDLYAAGLNATQILEEMPDLDQDPGGELDAVHASSADGPVIDEGRAPPAFDGGAKRFDPGRCREVRVSHGQPPFLPPAPVTSATANARFWRGTKGVPLIFRA